MKKGSFLTLIMMFTLIAAVIGGGVFFIVSPVLCQEGTGMVELDKALKDLKDAQDKYDKLINSGKAGKVELDAALENIQKAKEYVVEVKRTQREGGVEGVAPATASAAAGSAEATVHFPPGPPPGRPPEASEPVVHPPHPPHPAQPFGVPPGLAAHKILLAPAKVLVDFPTTVKGEKSKI